MTLNYTDEHALRNIDKSITSILESLKLISPKTTTSIAGRWSTNALISLQEAIQKRLAKHKREIEELL